MTDNKDDILVRRFFDENRVEVSDNGFSRRVMRRLPDRAVRIDRIWTAICVVAGILLFVRNKGLTVLSECFKDALGSVISQDSLLQNPLLLVFSLIVVVLTGCYCLIASERHGLI